MDTAVDNLDMLAHSEEMRTIAVETDVEDSAFLDLFKEEKGIEVVSKTFQKDNPPYAENIPGRKYTGLSFQEKYICVSSNEYIVKKNLVEKEWIV